jgi:hypothetical protein
MLKNLDVRSKDKKSCFCERCKNSKFRSSALAGKRAAEGFWQLETGKLEQIDWTEKSLAMNRKFQARDSARDKRRRERVTERRCIERIANPDSK